MSFPLVRLSNELRIGHVDPADDILLAGLISHDQINRVQNEIRTHSKAIIIPVIFGPG
jgi:hypothetical protein